MLRLRFTYQGKRRSLSLGIEDTRTNRGYALGIAQRIELDIRSNQLDESLNRYLTFHNYEALVMSPT